MHTRKIFGALCALGILSAAVLPARAGLLDQVLTDLSRVWGESDWTLGGNATSLIPVPAAAPVGTGSCPGVRPGAVVRSEVGQCTLNFLFHGSDNRSYIGTAGHCILQGADEGDVGEAFWPPGNGPVALDAAGQRIGEFAYAVLEDPKDFALIRTDEQVGAEAGMCHFGGPTGINEDQPGLLEPVVLQYFGEGVGVGTVLPARSALALGMPDPDHVFAQGVAVPGDSGSGVISSDGRAVGVLVTVGLHLNTLGLTGVDAGAMGITRLGPQLRRAEDVLGLGLTLRQASLE